MPQNIYDEPIFFEGYKKLRQGDTGLNGALEVPALRELLPDLSGARILDIGCGFGDFARHARLAGAGSVVALDVSQNMLSEAQRLTDDFLIDYVCSSIEGYSPSSQSFNLVVSSMALHYVDDYKAVAAKVYGGLATGGKFIFSVEHPICTANPIGWLNDDNGLLTSWPLDRYQDEGIRQTKWFVDGVLKYHRTVETYVGELLDAGFRLDHLKEPKPTDQALTEQPSLSINLRRPPVLLLGATKIA
jgi:SAM-dependent methyltransferase